MQINFQRFKVVSKCFQVLLEKIYGLFEQIFPGRGNGKWNTC